MPCFFFVVVIIMMPWYFFAVVQSPISSPFYSAVLLAAHRVDNSEKGRALVSFGGAWMFPSLRSDFMRTS
jgi:hypothetical protein